MVTFNVYDRVFFVRGATYGTAFSVDRHNRQYVVTARHVFGTDPTCRSIKIFHDEQWNTLPVEIVGIGVGEVDIAVLAPCVQLSPQHPLELSLGEFGLGQDMYFVGYPFKMWADGGPLMYGRPLPFVKKGTLSAFDTLSDIKRLWVDAINNEGFSGGPLVFQTGRSSELKIAGVVSKFRVEDEPVMDSHGSATDFHIQYNTGFLIAYGAKHVIDLIDRNPIGLPLEPANTA